MSSWWKRYLKISPVIWVILALLFLPYPVSTLYYKFSDSTDKPPIILDVLALKKENISADVDVTKAVETYIRKGDNIDETIEKLKQWGFTTIREVKFKRVASEPEQLAYHCEYPLRKGIFTGQKLVINMEVDNGAVAYIKAWALYGGL